MRKVVFLISMYTAMNITKTVCMYVVGNSVNSEWRKWGILLQSASVKDFGVEINLKIGIENF
jgi:hypothetical protein